MQPQERLIPSQQQPSWKLLPVSELGNPAAETCPPSHMNLDSPLDRACCCDAAGWQGYLKAALTLTAAACNARTMAGASTAWDNARESRKPGMKLPRMLHVPANDPVPLASPHRCCSLLQVLQACPGTDFSNHGYRTRLRPARLCGT